MRYSLVPAQEGNRLILTPHHTLPREGITDQSFIATVGAVTRLSVMETVVSPSSPRWAPSPGSPSWRLW